MLTKTYDIMIKSSSSLDYLLPREDSCFYEHGEAVLGRLKLALVRDEAVDASAQPDLAVAGQHAGRRLRRVARHIPTRRLQGASGPSGYYPMMNQSTYSVSCFIGVMWKSIYGIQSSWATTTALDVSVV